MIVVEQLKEASEKAVADINVLLSQLRRDTSEHNGTLAELEDVVGDSSIVCIVAKDSDRIVGMAYLYTLIKVGKRSGTVEDVVVDSEYRGQGLGSKLMNALLDIARRERLKQLYLTSRPDPDRTAAQKLYEKLGFKKQETDVFKLML